MSERSIDDVIRGLTEDLEPVKRIEHPLVRIAPFIVGGIIYVWFMVYYIGLRADYEQKLTEINFLFENASMALVGLSAALCAAWLCVPDMRGQKWMIATPFAFLSVFVIWTALRATTEGLTLPTVHFDHCMENGLWMAAVPAGIMAYISTRGATTKPLLSATMTVMSVTAFAYVGLRFTCMMDAIGHATIYHLIPFATLGTLVGLAAYRIFRW